MIFRSSRSITSSVGRSSSTTMILFPMIYTSSGIQAVKVLPSPITLVTVLSPPCIWMHPIAVASPRFIRPLLQFSLSVSSIRKRPEDRSDDVRQGTDAIVPHHDIIVSILLCTLHPYSLWQHIILNCICYQISLHLVELDRDPSIYEHLHGISSPN